MLQSLEDVNQTGVYPPKFKCLVIKNKTCTYQVNTIENTMQINFVNPLQLINALTNPNDFTILSRNSRSQCHRLQWNSLFSLNKEAFHNLTDSTQAQAQSNQGSISPLVPGLSPAVRPKLIKIHLPNGLEDPTISLAHQESNSVSLNKIIKQLVHF